MSKKLIAAIFRPFLALADAILGYFERHAFESASDDVRQPWRASALGLEEASIAPARRAAALIPTIMLALIILLILWATFFKIDIIAVGQGKVIPSTTVQQLSSLEGGVVRELLVREGQTVVKGQPLVRLDPVVAQGAVTEQAATRDGLMASIARLQAEANGSGSPVYPAGLKPEVVSEEERVRAQRAEALNSTIEVLQEQRAAKQAEAADFRGRIPQYESNLRLLDDQIQRMQPLVGVGSVAPNEITNLQRERGNLAAQIITTREGEAQASAQIAEAARKIEEKTSSFRSEAREELARKQIQLHALEGTLSGKEDILQRTLIRSPVNGIVKALYITTIGGVVTPGKSLVDIVPTNDSLLIEARIQPQDIAYIKLGNEAKVRITAFDSGALGSLDAQVELISPDSQADERSGSLYYKIQVRTHRNVVSTQAGNLNILPGMVADVDVITGRRTIMSYILRPIVRGMSRAMSER
ncbi:hemolysin D [Burkholderia diffusa]|uniref:HlyD family type I secretion periplasmic adaptor subunit n=1 Tax=Burkholderia diffusa TaxID=488732 RepID=UPI00075AE220|nr:HlyD family type I secretion periplasmic adaptor subunit [Burkholderia diffusa]KWF83507.1 hemolysin D [Burkholderia diffusa]